MVGERVEIELFLSLDQARRELNAFTQSAKQQIASLGAGAAATPAGVSSLAQQVGSFRGQLQASKAVGNITEKEYAALNRQMMAQLGLGDFRNKLRGTNPELLKQFDAEVRSTARAYRQMATATVIGTEQTAAGVTRIVAAEGQLAAATSRGAQLQNLSNEQIAANILSQRAAQAAQDKATRQALLASGQLTATQRLQVLGGSTNPQPLGQLLRTGLLTTAKYAGSAALLYGGISAITGMVSQAQVLEERFNLLESELAAVGRPELLEPLKRQIFDIASVTGVATEEVAGLAATIGPAFNFDPQTTSQALDVATKVARLADVAPAEIFNDLIAGARAFAEADPMGSLLDSQAEVMQRFADIGTAMRNLTGVSLKEFEDFIGRVAPSAEIAGFSPEQISAVGTALLQGSGVPGATLAEQFNRILTSFPDISLELAATVEEIPKLQAALGQVGLDKLFAGDASVIIEVAKAVGSLTDAEQRLFLHRIAGRREGPTLAALFNNPQTLVRALEQAQNAEGALDAEMQKRRETLAQQLRELGVAFAQFGQALYEAGLDDLLKDLVAVLRLLGDAFNFVGERLNGPIIGAVSELAVKFGELYLAARALQALGIINLFGGAAAAGGGGVLSRLLGRGGAAAAAGGAQQLVLPGLGAAATTGGGGLLSKIGGLSKFTKFGLLAGGIAITADTILSELEGDGPLDSIKRDVEDLNELAEDFRGKTNAELNEILESGRQPTGKRVSEVEKENLEDELERRKLDIRDKYLDMLVAEDIIDGKAKELFQTLYSTNRGTLTGGSLQDRALRGLFGGREPDIPEGLGLAASNLDDAQVDEFLFTGKEPKLGLRGFRGAIDRNKLRTLGPKLLKQVERELLGLVPEEKELGPVAQAAEDMQTAIQRFENGEISYQKVLQNLATQRRRLNRALAQGNKNASAKLVELDEVESGITDAAARSSYELDLRIGQLTQGNDPRLQIRGLQTLLSRTRNPEERQKVALELADAQQAMVKQMVSEADSAAEAVDILTRGIPIDPGVRVELIRTKLNDQFGQFQIFLGAFAGAGLQITDSMMTTLSLMISSGQSVIEFLRAQIEGQLNAALAAAHFGGVAGEGNPGGLTEEQVAKIRSAVDALNGQMNLLNSLTPDLGAGGVPSTVTDPQELARQQKRKAEEDARDAKELAEARAEYAKALAGDSPIASARAAQEAADRAFAEATNEAGRLRAQAERIRADRQMQEAILDIYAAHSELLIALANAAGDTVEAARLGADEARRLLDVERAKPDNKAGIERAEAAVVTAEAAERDARFRDALDRQAFLKEMDQITTGEYIAYLENLALDPKLTRQQREEVQRTIKQLKDELGQDLQFNLPTTLGLPTLYEARRIDQQGGRGNYTDNRQVMIVVQGTNNAEATAQAVYDKFNAAPRYGFQSRLY